MSETQPAAAAGWFTDQDDPRRERYWDGQQWSDRVRWAKAARTEPTKVPMSIGNKVLLSALIPLAGFILGGVELARGRGSQGALLFIVAIVSAIAWAVVLSAL